MAAQAPLLVVARRWDQLGTRLGAIVNARVIAELLELDFRFVWPRGADQAINEPTQLFSDRFLNDYEIDLQALQGRRCVSYHELMALSSTDRLAVLSAGSGAFIDMNELFGVVRDDEDDDRTAQRRYRRCFEEIGWNDEVRQLLAFTSRDEALDGLAGVHVRAGDVVTGAWRHSIAHQKYQPAPFVRQALAVFTGEGRPVLVLSDSAEYQDHLRTQFPEVVTPRDLLPRYQRLTEIQRALFDLLALSRCDPIVGPPASAFSKLAANLGGGIVARADTLAAAGSERDVLLAGIADGRRLADDSLFWRRVTARDLCWCLDVFGDTLDLGQQRELASTAVALDPDFCGALSRFGRVAVLAGDRRRARAATARAIALAEQVSRHDDPMFEALCSDLVVECLAWSGSRGDSPLTTIQAHHDRCATLAPFWFERDQILTKLEYLIEVFRSLSGEGYLARRRAIRRIRATGHRGLPTPRQNGLAEHRSRLLFDPISRDLDRIVLHISQALSS
jgi:hypothetical protein